MADDNSTTGVVDSPAQTDDVDGASQGSRQNQFSKLSKPSSGSQTYRIGPDGFNVGGQHIIVDYLVADGRTPHTKERGWVKAGSNVIITGKLGNLRVFDRAALWIGQTKRTLIGTKFENYQIILKVPDNIGNFISANGVIAVELGNGKESGILSDFLVYKPEKKEDSKGTQDTSGGGGGGQNKSDFGSQTASGQGGIVQGLTKGMVSDLVNAGPEILGNIVKAAVSNKKGTIAAPKAVDAPTASTTGKKVSNLNDEEYDSYTYEEGATTNASQTIASTSEAGVTGEVSSHATQAVGSTATQTTEVSREVGISSSTSGTATAQAAVETQVQQETQGSASVTAEVQQQTGGSTAGTVDVNVSGGRTNTTGTVSSAGAATGSVSLAGGLSMQQSMEIVGEHLEKNPGLVADVNVRQNVLESLSSGNLGNLNAEGQEALQQALKVQISANQPEASRLTAAMQNVGVAAGSSGQPARPQNIARPAAQGQVSVKAGQDVPVSPDVAINASTQQAAGPGASPSQIEEKESQAGPVKEETDLETGEKAGINLPKATPETPQPEKPVIQQTQAGEGSEGGLSAAGKKEPQGSREGLVKEAVVPKQNQNVDGVAVPPQYQAMINALGRKDQAREASEKSGSTDQPPSQNQKPEIAPSRKLGSLPGGEADEAIKPGQETGDKEPQPGLPERGRPGQAPEKSSGQPGESKELPEMPQPLSSEQLSHPEQGDRQEEKRPGGDEEADDGDAQSSEMGDELKQFAPGAQDAAGQNNNDIQKNKQEQAKVQQVAKEADKLVDGFLTQTAAWIWAAGLPSFGLSILLGAVAGDFLWAFKDGIIKRFLTPLLKTESLKKKADEIAKQIKISAKVKFNILAMNLAVLAVGVLLLMSVMAAMYVGCNVPVPYNKVSGYRLSYIGAIYPSMCEAMGSVTNSGIGAGNGAFTLDSSPSAPSAACSPVLAGPASYQNLQSTCFGGNAIAAASIANAESGGNTFSESRSDRCTDGRSVSIGLFQINISAHNLPGLECTKAFNHMYTASQPCTIINESLYSQCVQAAKDASTNIAVACQISGNGQSWGAWGANLKCGF